MVGVDDDESTSQKDGHHHFDSGLVAIGQVPNLVVQLTMPAFNQVKQAQLAQLATSKNELSRKLAAQEISAVEYEEQLTGLEAAWEANRKQQEEARDAMLTRYAVISNQVLPIAWLPLSTSILLSILSCPCFAFWGWVALG